MHYTQSMNVRVQARSNAVCRCWTDTNVTGDEQAAGLSAHMGWSSTNAQVAYIEFLMD